MNKKQKNTNENNIKAEEIAKTLSEPTKTDVLGSWTGNPDDGGVPVQDADDL